MTWVPVLAILSLLNSLVIGEQNKIEEAYTHGNKKYQKRELVLQGRPVEDKLKAISDDYDEYGSPDFSKYLMVPYSWENAYNNEVQPLSKTKYDRNREITGLHRKKRKLETVFELTIGENQAKEKIRALNYHDDNHVTDRNDYNSVPKDGYDINEHTCSGQRCSSLGGNCVQRDNTTCSQDTCGKRSFISPCNCDTEHCCCMPVTCPPDSGSEDYQRCKHAGGYCLYKDMTCDGECLPLCGPSCTCCIQACSEPGKRCGTYEEGTCKLKCDEGKGEEEYPHEKCAGANCRCCGPKKFALPNQDSLESYGFGRNSLASHDERKERRKGFCKEEIYGQQCLNGTGLYRKDCENGEAVIEYITPICKCCAKDACPLAGSLCSKERGMCKPKCDDNEAEGDDSICGTGPGCSCCMVKACTNSGKTCNGNMNRTGVCTEHCHLDYEPIGICPEKFGDCLCCAPKVCGVSIGSTCPAFIGDSKNENNAVCKPHCDVHEKEHGTCPGPSCKCCISSVCENLGKSCSNDQGSCKPSCAENEQIDGTCPGSHCYCCIPKPCDNLWGPCGNGGICKSECLTSERSTPGCTGYNCTCCVPMKCVASMGSCGYDKKGFCRSNCIEHEIFDMSATCNGFDCTCCREKDCHYEGKTCLNGTGKCRSECLRSEIGKVDNSTCTGLRCKCCVLKDCIAPGASCGIGLSGKCKNTCDKGFEDDVGRCEGNKCRCCKEKDCRNHGCSCGGKLDGTCKPHCDIYEEAVTRCEGRDCSCCIGKFCESINKPCGGHMNGQCKHTCMEPEINVGQCAGLECKCCALQSCTNPESTCGLSGKGRCRAVCYDTEEVVGTCAGTNCSCCQVKMCSDPGSCCDQVSIFGDEISGTCKHRCSETEEIVSACGGLDCKCCSPMKCMHFGSPCGIKDAKGICKNKCSNAEEVIGKCKGADCKCCALKVCQSEGSMCTAEGYIRGYGRCMHKCQETEEEIGACPGAQCKCCASKPCLQYNGPCGKNGNCRDRCLPTEEPTGKCKGSHCICCEPKMCPETGPKGCSSNGGVCQRECDNEDLAPNAIPGLCGRDCHCCNCKATPELIIETSTMPPCAHLGGPCGNHGTCQPQCMPGEVAHGRCRGASCSCCEKNNGYTGDYNGNSDFSPLAGTCSGTCDGGEGHAHGHCAEGCPAHHILPGHCPGEMCLCCMVHPGQDMKTNAAISPTVLISSQENVKGFSHTMLSSSPETLTVTPISNESQDHYMTEEYDYNLYYGHGPEEDNKEYYGHHSNHETSVEA